MVNMFFMACYQVLTIAFGLLLPNLIIHRYGAELHGFTTTATTIMSYVALINAGLAPAAIQALYKPLNDGDKHRINEVVNAIGRFYTISGLLYTVAVVVIALVLPFILADELPTYMIIGLMLAIGAGNTLECFVYSKYKVLLQADQRLYVAAIVDTVIYLIRIALQLILIFSECSLILVMVVPAVLVLFRMAMLSIYCRRCYPDLDRKVPPDNSSLSKRWSAMLHQIAGLVVNNTDVLLLSVFENLRQVSIYSVYGLVFNHITLLFNNVFSSGTIASFGKAIEEHDEEKLRNAYGTFEFGYYFVVAFVYGVCASMVLSFVGAYTVGMEGIDYVDPLLALLFIIIGIANHMRMPGLNIINAAGHFKETQWRAIAEAAINLIVSLCLLKPFGMYGLLIGTICSYCYRTTDIIFYSHRVILKASPARTILRFARTVLIVAVSAGLYRLFVNVYSVDGWLYWILYAVVASMITAIVDLAFNLVTEPGQIMTCIKIILHKA